MTRFSRLHRTLGTLGVLSLLLGAAAAPALADEDDVRARHVHRWVTKGVHGGAFLGVQALDMTEELRRHYGAPEDAGVLVGRIVEESAASAAGIEVGDIVTEIDSKELTRPADLILALRDLEKDDTVVLQVWRDGRPMEITAVLQERTDPYIQTIAPGVHFIPDFEFDWKGVDPDKLPRFESLKGLEDLGQHLGQYFSSPEWQDSIQKMDFYRGDLVQRLEEMEQRLQEMEQRLQETEEGN